MMNWKEFVSRLCATMSVTGYGILFFVAINSPLFYYFNQYKWGWNYVWYDYKYAIIFGSLMPKFAWIIKGAIKENE